MLDGLFEKLVADDSTQKFIEASTPKDGGSKVKVVAVGPTVGPGRVSGYDETGERAAAYADLEAHPIKYKKYLGKIGIATFLSNDDSTGDPKDDIYLVRFDDGLEIAFSKTELRFLSGNEANESDDSKKYGVIMLGGSIGSKEKTPKPFDSKEAAKEYADRMNKQLSKGEKGYYKIRYKVVELDEAKEPADFEQIEMADDVEEVDFPENKPTEPAKEACSKDKKVSKKKSTVESVYQCKKCHKVFESTASKCPRCKNESCDVLHENEDELEFEKELGIPQNIADQAFEYKESGLSWKEVVNTLLDDNENRKWFDNEYQGNEFDLRQELEEFFTDEEVEESKTNEISDMDHDKIAAIKKWLSTASDADVKSVFDDFIGSNSGGLATFLNDVFSDDKDTLAKIADAMKDKQAKDESVVKEDAEQLNILAKGIADKATADKMAQEKQGVTITDPDDKTKFAVATKVKEAKLKKGK